MRNHRFSPRVAAFGAAFVLPLALGSCDTGSPPSGDGGPPEKAQLNDPAGVFVDKSGILYIADTLNQRVRAFKTAP